MRFLLAILIATVLAALTNPLTAATPGPIVSLQYGNQYQGSTNGQINSFLGIPFVQNQPIGDNRLRLVPNIGTLSI